MNCVAQDCAGLDAATEFAIAPVEPAAELLCLTHYRDLVKGRAQREEARQQAARRAEILAMPKMTCYGDGGTCTAIGDPYPGGPYCPRHAPNPFAAKAAPAVRSQSLINLFADEADDAGDEEEEPVAEPLLPGQTCPPEHMPGSVKTAVKRAQTHGWAHRVTIAIGPEPELLHSVAFSASKDDVTVSSRHEGNDPETLRFKVGWHQRNNDLPIAIGWRELTAALEGTDPNETDKRHMRQAVLDVMDIGGTVTEIRATG